MSKHFDWRRAALHGINLAAENYRDYDKPEAWQGFWELLVEAVAISRGYDAPPRSTYPTRAMMPDAPDDVTWWQIQMDYIRGTLDEIPEEEPTPVMPSAIEVSRADAVLDLWHKHALMRGDGPHPKRPYIYKLAEGMPLGVVMRMSGMKRHEVLAMKAKAATQMMRAAGVE